LLALAKGLKAIAQPPAVVFREIIRNSACREKGGADIDGDPDAGAFDDHGGDVVTSMSRDVFARCERLRFEPYPKAIVMPPGSRLFQAKD
jgi:hypothetical protein